MTPEALLEQFDVMAESPGGVEQVRKVILQLAVRGELRRPKRGRRGR